MITVELLNTLRQLDKAEKLRVIQVLASELTVEEDHLIESEKDYPIWSPHHADKAADVMLKLLREAETPN